MHMFITFKIIYCNQFLIKSFITFLLFLDYEILLHVTSIYYEIQQYILTSPEKYGGSIRNLNDVQSFTWEFQIYDSKPNKEMQINVNEQLALMSVTLFVLIEASCSVATVRIHLLELDQALCERAGNESA